MSSASMSTPTTSPGRTTSPAADSHEPCSNTSGSEQCATGSSATSPRGYDATSTPTHQPNPFRSCSTVSRFGRQARSTSGTPPQGSDTPTTHLRSGSLDSFATLVPYGARNDTVGYARTGSGNEIDLLPTPVSSPAGRSLTVPIEGKWVDDQWRSEARTIEAKYGHGILATKSILNTDHPAWAIPALLLTLLLPTPPYSSRNALGAPAGQIRRLHRGHDDRSTDTNGATPDARVAGVPSSFTFGHRPHQPCYGPDAPPTRAAEQEESGGNTGDRVPG